MDIDRVNDWFAQGALLRPDYSRPSTVNLGRALAGLSGSDLVLAGPDLQVREAIGEAEHLVLVLADGLGMELVEGLPEDSFLRSHLAMELQATFPSSTAPALTSLATGEWPASHGLLGWFGYLPEQDVHAVTLPFRERFSGRLLADLGVTGEELLPWQPLLQGYRRSAYLLMPASLKDSVYTQRIGAGAVVEGYRDLEAAVTQLVDRIQTAVAPSYTYFYYPRVDSTVHEHGLASSIVKATVRGLDTVLERLHSELRGRARIIVSADHGAIDIDAAHKVLINPDDRPLVMLRTPPSGEPRVPLFHVKPGALDDFAEAFRAQFGEQFALLSTDEAIELQLFGPHPPSQVARARMGDYLALSATGDALVYGLDEGIGEMVGFHGGLDPREMRIPLIVA